jgi:magnesium-protoporphyrin O-methyltransferase
VDCCTPHGCDELFGERFARRTAKRYRERGLDETAADLHEFLARRGGASALEIGGGVGALVAELVRGGVERGQLVEIVPAYEPYARQLFEDAGVEVDFRLADLVTEPDAVEPADLVVLNKVVCCTPDGPELLAAAAAHTGVALAFSYPRERLLFRTVVWLQNLFFRLARRRFRVFVHPRGRLLGAAEANGLRLVHERAGFVWATAGFVRA